MTAAPPAPPSPGAPSEEFYVKQRYVFRRFADGHGYIKTELVGRAITEGWAQRIADGLNVAVPNG